MQNLIVLVSVALRSVVNKHFAQYETKYDKFFAKVITSETNGNKI